MLTPSKRSCIDLVNSSTALSWLGHLSEAGHVMSPTAKDLKCVEGLT